MGPLLLYCKSSSPPPPHISLLTNIPKKFLTGALTGALSFTLLASPLPSLSLNQPSTFPVSPCVEENVVTRPEVFSDKGLVEEAWEIVQDGFLDYGNTGKWSPQSWLNCVEESVVARSEIVSDKGIVEEACMTPFHYDGKQKKEDVLSSSIQSRGKAHDIIKRMLASLGDPDTRFLSPSEFSKMARYDMTGIGMNIGEIPDDNGAVKLKVLVLILDGPAHTAGVRQGDEVLAVNGVDISGKSAFEVSSMLQGPSETFVTIKHGNCGPVQSIDIQRQLVARSPVLYRLEKMGTSGTSVGYVRLKEFNELARKDLLIALERLKDMGASSFILDLKDNRGGLVQEGIEIAKLFLEEGEMIISTVGRDPQYQNSVVAESLPKITAPVIVLVNSNTASASEIVASALHDNCKAVLVGDKTFGKGLIQSVFELHDGSGVAVTVRKYVTSKHMDINGNGIDPDFQNLPAWMRSRNNFQNVMHNSMGENGLPSCLTFRLALRYNLDLPTFKRMVIYSPNVNPCETSTKQRGIFHVSFDVHFMCFRDVSGADTSYIYAIAITT